VTETAIANETLQEAAKVNTLENFAFVFNKVLESLFIERMEGNEEIFKRLMNDDEFRTVATEHLVREVYEQIRASPKEPGGEVPVNSEAAPVVTT
jgi:type I restriction enzyme R subunit